MRGSHWELIESSLKSLHFVRTIGARATVHSSRKNSYQILCSIHASLSLTCIRSCHWCHTILLYKFLCPSTSIFCTRIFLGSCFCTSCFASRQQCPSSVTRFVHTLFFLVPLLCTVTRTRVHVGVATRYTHSAHPTYVHAYIYISTRFQSKVRVVTDHIILYFFLPR